MADVSGGKERDGEALTSLLRPFKIPSSRQLPGALLIILREFRRQCSAAKTSGNTLSTRWLASRGDYERARLPVGPDRSAAASRSLRRKFSEAASEKVSLRRAAKRATAR